MSISKVESALIQQVVSLMGSIPTGYENHKFDKPASPSMWAQVFFIPNDPTVWSLGSAGQDFGDGILQIDLNVPLLSGRKAVNDQFELIRSHFSAGVKFTHEGQVVTIRSCGRSAGRRVDGWYRVSITISWYSLISR